MDEMIPASPHNVPQQTRQIELPFKPFTLDEVQAITECDRKVLDHWVEHNLGLIMGSGAFGLTYMQTFAVFVGWRYLKEGAPLNRATAVVEYVSAITMENMAYHFSQGDTFPVPWQMREGIPKPGIMVKPPDNVLGRRLRLDTLYREFQYHLTRVFPEG